MALEVLPMLEEEARARQSAAGGDNRDRALDKIIYQAVERGPQSIDTAAQLVGTNRQYVSDAKAIAAQLAQGGCSGPRGGTVGQEARGPLQGP